ncbi:hypothetical protein [Gaoshiqia sp. Z1-71]|uniref:hypothetical protein n=1 Tax=Gaoshiqia hydrogeniformans TaxID=3290090 RepID=UPI003BF7AAE1
MKKILFIALKITLCLFYLALSFLFFYIDFFIFKYVIWASWKSGSLQLHETLNIFVFSFSNNMAYLPFFVYLAAGLLFLALSIRMFYRGFLNH